jgi:hypothetical protein
MDYAIELREDNHNVKPDQRDYAFVLKCFEELEKINGPRVGDYCILPNGEYRRFAYDWGEDIQITGSYGDGSFYLGKGYVSMSGGLDPAIPKTCLTLTEEKKKGYYWTFHHNFHFAHNGIGIMALCRVYKAEGNFRYYTKKEA